jgi:glycosyltransferase involved in cell wall biosynthesis
MKRTNSKNKNKLISVIVPAYKAEKFIEKSLLNTKGVLDQIRYDYEIICVVDGRLDKTFEKAGKLANKYPEKIKVIGYEKNMGKGHAVRFGMAKARGDIVSFVDAGTDLKSNGFSMLLEHFEWYDADVIVGSKRHPASKVYYPWQRKIMSFAYQMLVRILFNLKIRDTQVGMKLYKREVLVKTLPRLLVKEFAFDIEMLSVANYLGFTKIYEAPIELKMEFGGSSILKKGFFKTVFNTLRDTAAVFYRLRILKFYDYKNRGNWITPKHLTLDRHSSN